MQAPVLLVSVHKRTDHQYPSGHIERLSFDVRVQVDRFYGIHDNTAIERVITYANQQHGFRLTLSGKMEGAFFDLHTCDISSVRPEVGGPYPLATPEQVKEVALKLHCDAHVTGPDYIKTLRGDK